MADAGETVPDDASYSCSLAWGGVCVAVSTALWIAAAFMTLRKGRKDRMEEAEKEEVQAEAQRVLGKEEKEANEDEENIIVDIIEGI